MLLRWECQDRQVITQDKIGLETRLLERIGVAHTLEKWYNLILSNDLHMCVQDP